MQEHMRGGPGPRQGKGRAHPKRTLSPKTFQRPEPQRLRAAIRAAVLSAGFRARGPIVIHSQRLRPPPKTNIFSLMEETLILVPECQARQADAPARCLFAQDDPYHPVKHTVYCYH